CVVSWSEHAVPGRSAGRRDDHGLRTERRARDKSRALGTGGGCPPGVVAGPHLRRHRGRRPSGRPVAGPGAIGAETPEGASVNDPRNLIDRELTRRRFVQGTALAGFATFLAACGRAGSSAAPSAAPSAAAASEAPSAAASAAPSASAAPTPKPSTSAELNFANWTYYLDFDPKTKKSATLDQF